MRAVTVVSLVVCLFGFNSGCEDTPEPADANTGLPDTVADTAPDTTADALDNGSTDTTDAAETDAGFDTSKLAPLWTPLKDMPQALWGIPVVAHPTTGLIHGFGGTSSPSGAVNGFSWLYSPSADQWGSNTVAGSPAARYCHCMTAMPERNAYLVVGGRNDMGGLPSGAWVYHWDTSTWTTVAGDVPLGAIGCHAGWLPEFQGGRAVVFGGQGLESTDPDGMDLKTWLFDPDTETFSLLSVANTPPGRRDGAVASDTAGGRVLMFGGQTKGFPTPDHTNDLWAFDGTDWSQVVSTGVRPSPRRFPAAAFDPVRRVWIMYAGTVETYIEDDLWLYDAGNDSWRSLDTTNAPTKRAFAPMAWDAKSQAFYLFGGAQTGGALAFKDGFKLTLQ